MVGVVVRAFLPCLAWLSVSCLALAMLCLASRARLNLSRLGQLHGNEMGNVQSLSFVLVLPFFLMIVLFIVQVSQLMIGTIIVHYAAFAAARAAAIWIPASMPGEGPCCISSRHLDPEAQDQTPPAFDPSKGDYGPTGGGLWFVVQPGSPKYDKITSAAVMACLPISPSRDVGVELSGRGPAAAEIIQRAYAALAPGSSANTAIPRRIENKLAYAMANTTVEMRFYHKNSEAPLVQHFLKDDPGEFYFNEVGWQDPITVTVRHNLALLPGPGRFLAKHVVGPGGAEDKVSQAITRQGDVYTYPLSASATISNHGEKSLISHVYPAY